MDLKSGLLGIPKIVENIKYYKNLTKLCHSGSKIKLQIVDN